MQAQETWSQKRVWLLLLGIFLGAVLVYGAVAAGFDSTRSGRADESIYINMARSFHYDHNFLRGGEPMGYDCIIYSVLLSLSYFFYTPEHILTVMRLLGVVVMSSAIFPAYLLGKRVLGQPKKALFAAVLAVLIPSMTLSYYMYQEVLLYPLALWFLYFFYSGLESRQYRHQAAAGAFLYLLYNTKTICMYVLLAYLLFLFLDFLLFHREGKRLLLNIVITVGVFLLLYAAVRGGIDLLNGGGGQASHYNSQIGTSISLFFQNPGHYVPQVIRGIFFYSYYTLLSLLAIPFLLPVLSWQQLNDKDRKLLLLSALCVVSAILLIVGGIFLLEDSGSTTPRFHSRYFFSFFFPFVLLTLKVDPSRIALPKVMLPLLGILLLFPFLMPDGFVYFSSFVDNYLFSPFEAVHRFLPGAAVPLLAAGMALYGVLVLAVLILCKKGKITQKMPAIVLALFFVALNVGNTGIITVYKNTQTWEQEIDHDTLTLARFLDEENAVSAFVDQDGVYSRVINYNTQLRKDYFYYLRSQAVEGSLTIDSSVDYIIVPQEAQLTPQGLEEIDIGLAMAKVYRWDEEAVSWVE